MLGLSAPLLENRARRKSRKALRRLLRELGPARDWEVFLALTLGPALAAAPEDRGRAALARRGEQHRAQALARAQRAIAAQPASRLAVPSVAAKPARVAARRFARDLLQRTARRVRRRGKGLSRLDPASLHRLRLAVKRLRYALHYFASLFSERRIKPVRVALESLQQALGGANDCAVAEALLRQLRVAQDTAIARRNAAWLAAYRRELRSGWRAFRDAGNPWE
ncbi:MAG: CHAD domain-containing protein [Betaproteobacteria bacterium]|nr:CHAD domain-containing protein [Betaproteobacteria bacterium]